MSSLHQHGRLASEERESERCAESPIRVWRLQYGPCWCRRTPDDTDSFDFVRLTTSTADLGSFDRNVLIVSDRVIDGSQPVFLQVYERVPSPKLVVATAPCHGAARFWEELPVGWSPVEDLLPVDIHIDDECVTGNPEVLMARVLGHVLSETATSSGRADLAVSRGG